jgi:hypothetical protein
MIDRGINASAGMLIVNPNARNTAKIGMGNDMFRKGSIHYVGSEIRAVILNKMMVDTQYDDEWSVGWAYCSGTCRSDSCVHRSERG